MTPEEEIFSGAVLQRERALASGFCEREGVLWREQPLCGGQFRLEVCISPAGEAACRLIDVLTQEEYVLHRIEGATGAFVEQVRAEYRAALLGIRDACFDRSGFRADDKRALFEYAFARYGDRPEYLWEDSPAGAVLRRSDNRKWYAVFLSVRADKLGLARSDTPEIVDFRMLPQELDAAVDGKRYFRGWHMNKKHWVTVVLGGTLPVARLQAMLDESYRLAGTK